MSTISSSARDSRLERGSFRDRTARVFYRDGRVFRALGAAAAADWQALWQARFFQAAMAEGRIVRTEECDPSQALDALDGEAPAIVLEHERVPFVSYPYEWPFGMLKDAALVVLDLERAALDEGFSLKDGTSYNVQWRGAAPVFIDVPSFQRLRPGEPWAGYRQFCELFLYPLFLQAYRQVPFQPWLRGSIDGITPEQMAQVMSARDCLRRGVLTHVFLHAKLQARYGETSQDVRATLRGAGFGAELVKANVRRLRGLVASLDWRPPATVWAEYADRNRYAEADAERKRAFVARVAAERRRALVWDLGCNTGFFSRLVASSADTVVAMDADHAVIERLYRHVRQNGPANLLPLVVNLADPSPALGWRGAERQTLEARGRPDLVLCLALLHHLVIGANVPLAEAVDWLASVGEELIIEFVTRDDPMVHKLLRNREDHYTDYHREVFERHLAGRCQILARTELCGGARILYHARRRPAP